MWKLLRGMLPGILEGAHPRDVLRDIPTYPPTQGCQAPNHLFDHPSDVTPQVPQNILKHYSPIRCFGPAGSSGRVYVVTLPMRRHDNVLIPRALARQKWPYHSGGLGHVRRLPHLFPHSVFDSHPQFVLLI